MNDYNLIKKCQNGDKEAFNELISLYYPYVFNFLLKLTGNVSESEDLVQETFIKLIRNIENYNKKISSFGTYLIVIAKNTYIDFLRKNKELQEIDIESCKDYNNDYEKIENYNEVLELIQKLPRLQQEAIKLKYLEGYTLKEIAAIQKSEIKTIKSRLFESRKKLKQLLKGDEI